METPVSLVPRSATDGPMEGALCMHDGMCVCAMASVCMCNCMMARVFVCGSTCVCMMARVCMCVCACLDLNQS